VQPIAHMDLAGRLVTPAHSGNVFVWGFHVTVLTAPLYEHLGLSHTFLPIGFQTKDWPCSSRLDESEDQVLAFVGRSSVSQGTPVSVSGRHFTSSRSNEHSVCILILSYLLY
jgi:hypothetical protein